MSKKVYGTVAEKQAAYRQRLKDDEKRKLVKELVRYYATNTVSTEHDDGYPDKWYLGLQDRLMEMDTSELRASLALLKSDPDRHGGGKEASGEAFNDEGSSLESLANATEPSDDDGTVNAAREELIYRAAAKVAGDGDQDMVLQSFRAGDALQNRIDAVFAQYLVALGESQLVVKPDGTLAQTVSEDAAELFSRLADLRDQLRENTVYHLVLTTMKEIRAADLATRKEERRMTREWRKKQKQREGITRRKQRAQSIEEGWTPPHRNAPQERGNPK